MGRQCLLLRASCQLSWLFSGLGWLGVVVGDWGGGWMPETRKELRWGRDEVDGWVRRGVGSGWGGEVDRESDVLLAKMLSSVAAI